MTTTPSSNALTLSVAAETVDDTAHALAGKARFSLSIGAKRLTFTRPVSKTSSEMSSHLHGELPDLLSSIPAGDLLLVRGSGSPRCIDAQLAAVVAAGFTLRGVVWHYEHDIGGVRTKAVTERMVRMVFSRD